MLQPRNDWVLIRILKENTTAAGLIKPENAFEEYPKGVVVAVGPGPRIETTGERAPMDLREGDVVHCFGSVVAIDSREQLVLTKEQNVMCFVERAVVN